MAIPTRIALSGQIGSGKSAVGTRLAAALGYSYLSTGSIQRAIAARRGLTTLELNKVAATDPSIDKEIDDYLKIDVNAMERVVVDSRMAFHFLASAIKVSLVIDPRVAVERVMNANRAEETYASHAEATDAIAQRNRLERERFEHLYGVNLHSLRNYDIVIDTSTASIDEVVTMIVTEVKGFDEASQKPRCWLSAKRLFPTKPHNSMALKAPLNGGYNSIEVIESDRVFFVVDGQATLRKNITQGSAQVLCQLQAIGDELLPDGSTAREFVRTHCTAEVITNWEIANDFAFMSAPLLV